MKLILLNIIPHFLRKRIESSQNLQKILANAGWLFGDQILRMAVGLIVGVWVARYLGPEQFGLLNFAGAFVAIFSVIGTLGLNNIVVRNIVKEPTCKEETLGTAFVLQFFGGLLGFLIVVGVISLMRSDEVLTRLIVTILGFTMVFKAAEVVKCWFESQVKSKYTVWVENGVFLAIAAVKIGMILLRASLTAFVWAVFVEALVVAVGFMLIYAWRGGRLRAWKVRLSQAKSLLKDSWPLALSSLTIIFYMRIDQIMLGQILDDKAVGIYSAAVRISELWYFIPVAIAASVFPAIIEAKKKSEEFYCQRLQKLYDLMIIIAVSIALPMTFLSSWVATSLFGRAYAASGTVLAIHIWAGVFVFLGVASGKWFLVENLQKLAFYRTFWGMVINILLNILLIPKYGVVGAAIATVISYSIAALWFDAFNKNTKAMFRMKINSLIFKGIIYDR